MSKLIEEYYSVEYEIYHVKDGQHSKEDITIYEDDSIQEIYYKISTEENVSHEYIHLWYFDEKNPNESIKISIRFLTNEVRSDALDIKIFKKTCLNNLMNCKISQKKDSLNNEIKKEILKKATIYKEQESEKNKKTKKKSN